MKIERLKYSILNNLFFITIKLINSYWIYKNENIIIFTLELRFIYYCEDIDAALFGITKEKELEEILKIWKSFKKSSQYNEDPYINYAWHNIKDIDPRTWQN